MANQDQCGHQLPPSELPTGTLPTTCERPTWDDQDSCVWHSDSENKQESDLNQDDLDGDCRIDGVILRDMAITDAIMFDNCQLFNADFSNSDLSGINFTGSDLRNADFTGAKLDHAQFENGTNAEGASFQEADLTDARFGQARLTGTCFENCEALSADYSGAELMEASFQDADLRDADFREANLRSADVMNSKLMNAKLSTAILERADLTDADLREATISGIQVYECDLRDVRVDHRTRFGNICLYEDEADKAAEQKICSDSMITRKTWNLLPLWIRRLIWRNYYIPLREPDPSHLKQAVWVYRDLQRILQENSLPAEKRRFSIREKHAGRKLAYEQGNHFSWFKSALSHRGMLYGESPWYVIRTSLAIIMFFSVIYALTGLRDTATGTVYSLVPRPTLSWEAVSALLQFSITRFLTASNGGHTAIGMGKLIATIQSAFGAFLLALFVFVLGRRATG